MGNPATHTNDPERAAAFRARPLRLAAAAAGALVDRASGAAHARMLDRLRGLHGLPEKVAQLMMLGSMGDDDAESGGGPPALTSREVHAILNHELGTAASRFVAIDETGVGASIGQVHRGRLDDGRSVAVKVQFPGVREGIESDISALGWLVKPMGNLRRDFPIDAYRRELRSMLLAEADYELEADALRRFAGRVAHWDGIAIPRPIDGLCSRRVLTMEWLDGGNVAACRTWTPHDRHAVASALVRFFVASIANWREIYADAHPGNFLFCLTPRGPDLGILDFGCIRSLNDRAATALVILLDAAAGNSLSAITPNRILELYGEMDFDLVTLEPFADRLSQITELLFEPFTVRGGFDPAQWSLNARATDLLGPHRIAFRSAGPPALLAVIRAYYGAIRHLIALDAPVDWRAIYLDLRRDAIVAAMAPRQPHPHGDRTARATGLRIRVEESGAVRVDVTMPAEAASRLGDLVPDHVAELAVQRGIDIDSIARRAAESQFSPQELFVARDGSKVIRVWLG